MSVFEKPFDLFVTRPIDALAGGLFSLSYTMKQSRPLAVVTRPLAKIVEGAGRGLRKATDEQDFLALGIVGACIGIYASAVTVAAFSLTPALTPLPFAAACAVPVLASAVVFPWACAAVLSLGFAVCKIPAALRGIPEGLRYMKGKEEALDASFLPSEEPGIEQRFSSLSAGERSAAINNLFEKFPDDFAAVAQRIKEKDAALRGETANPVRLIRKIQAEGR